MKGNAAKWFAMIKDTMPTEKTFRTLFLKHLFSEDRQWVIFIKCTKTGKQPIKKQFSRTLPFLNGQTQILKLSKDGPNTGYKFNYKTLFL